MPALADAPFHAGEQQIQEILGVKETMAAWGSKVIRPFMPEQHREFYQKLPYVLVGSLDSQGRPWASLIFGPPGFIQAPDTTTLDFSSSIVHGDPLHSNLQDGCLVGLLGIELHTRRRNRLNGRVRRQVGEEDGRLRFRMEVHQTFGNCPKYIQARKISQITAAPDAVVEKGTTLGSTHKAIISKADTFFIATEYHDDGDEQDDGKPSSHNVDVSHRGGIPGFVRVVSDSQILFPDYKGNNHFNTLGNILKNSKCGLLFVDFDTGDALFLTGTATIDFDDVSEPGALRSVSFALSETILVRRAMHLDLEYRGLWSGFADLEAFHPQYAAYTAQSQSLQASAPQPHTRSGSPAPAGLVVECGASPCPPSEPILTSQQPPSADPVPEGSLTPPHFKGPSRPPRAWGSLSFSRNRVVEVGVVAVAVAAAAILVWQRRSKIG